MHGVVGAESSSRDVLRLRHSHGSEDEILARRSGRGEVDDRVPEAHEGKDDAGGVLVRDRDRGRVREAVNAVDRRRHPRHQQRDEEQQRHFRIPPRRPVRFHGRIALAPLHRDQAQRMRPRLRRGRPNVDGILFVAFVERRACIARSPFACRV